MLNSVDGTKEKFHFSILAYSRSFQNERALTNSVLISSIKVIFQF